MPHVSHNPYPIVETLWSRCVFEESHDWWYLFASGEDGCIVGVVPVETMPRLTLDGSLDIGIVRLYSWSSVGGAEKVPMLETQWSRTTFEIGGRMKETDDVRAFVVQLSWHKIWSKWWWREVQIF